MIPIFESAYRCVRYGRASYTNLHGRADRRALARRAVWSRTEADLQHVPDRTSEDVKRCSSSYVRTDVVTSTTSNSSTDDAVGPTPAIHHDFLSSHVPLLLRGGRPSEPARLAPQVRMDHADISGCAVEPGPVHHFHTPTQSGETLLDRFGGLDPRKSALWEVPVALRDRCNDGAF